MNFFKSKKAQTNELIAICLILLVYGIVFMISYVLLSSFVNAMSTSTYWNSQMNEAANKFLGALRMCDYVMVILTIALVVAIGVTTYRLATPTIYFVITLITGCFYGFIAYFLSYIFQTFAQNAFFNAAILYFPRTILICTNLHWVALIGLVIGSITLYGKKPRGQYLE